jgi:mono/diheme cytochrome c family protein
MIHVKFIFVAAITTHVAAGVSPAVEGGILPPGPSHAQSIAPERSTTATADDVASHTNSLPQLGQKLFDRNCAHCHGDDARGDEGPDLHNLKLSDARIAKRIKDGVKGEMPSFGSKLDNRDVEALTAYLRTLKD